MTTPAELRALATKLRQLYDAHEEVCRVTDPNSVGDHECALAEGCYAASRALPALLDQLEAAERDAERYRWILMNPEQLAYRWASVDGLPIIRPEHRLTEIIDAAIDAARAGK